MASAAATASTLPSWSMSPAAADLAHTFTVTDGSPSAPWTLSPLLPGSYTVSEPSPGPGWSAATGGGGVTVNSGSPAANSTITNHYLAPGTSLQLPIGVSPSVLGPTGGNVTITVQDKNTGNVPLDNPTMDLLITPPGSPLIMLP